MLQPKFDSWPMSLARLRISHFDGNTRNPRQSTSAASLRRTNRARRAEGRAQNRTVPITIVACCPSMIVPAAAVPEDDPETVIVIYQVKPNDEADPTQSDCKTLERGATARSQA